MTRFVLGLAILVACITASAQSTQAITVRNLTLVNLTQVPVEDYQQVVRSVLDPFKCDCEKSLCDCSQENTQIGPDAIPARVRDALQQRGYFRAEVSDSEITIVGESPSEKIVDVAVRVNPGSIFKLNSLILGGNRAFDIYSPEQLRTHMPISPGDVFDTEKVRVGLENLRKLYADEGYIDFTSVPKTKVVEQLKGIILQISLIPGDRFYFGKLDLNHLWPMPEAAQTMAADWSSLKGRPYSPSELDAFMKQHSEVFSGDFQLDRNVGIHEDPKTHTVIVEPVR